jgi:hypothetical protein
LQSQDRNRGFGAKIPIRRRYSLAASHILEMLCVTPLLAQPQNDLVPTQIERNAEIRARYETEKPWLTAQSSDEPETEDQFDPLPGAKARLRRIIERYREIILRTATIYWL